MLCFFFFSSRRRHTRWPRDWSSDVCSSDLGTCGLERADDLGLVRRQVPGLAGIGDDIEQLARLGGRRVFPARGAYSVDARPAELEMCATGLEVASDVVRCRLGLCGRDQVPTRELGRCR